MILDDNINLIGAMTDQTIWRELVAFNSIPFETINTNYSEPYDIFLLVVYLLNAIRSFYTFIFILYVFFLGTKMFELSCEAHATTNTNTLATNRLENCNLPVFGEWP